MNHKNIDKLFQDQLKNLETTPNERVWKNIETKLSQKKRKAIPIWWFTSGVAALFLLAFFLFSLENKQEIIPQNDSKTIITEAPSQVQEASTPKKSLHTNSKKDNIAIAKKTLPEKKNKHHKETTTKRTEKKKLVSTKNAMKKVFLADHQHQNEHLKKNKSEKKEEIMDNQVKANANSSKKTVSKKNVAGIDFKKSLQQKDSIFINTTQEKKWSVAPVFAVLNSNSFSKKIPVNQNLSNTLQGENSFSYGVQVGYKINSKWTIRSGVHIQETRFTNNNVPLVSIASDSFFSSISFDDANFAPQTATDTSGSSELGNTPFANTTSLTGNLSQNYGYIEIPVEIKYNVYSTKKFNSEIVGGFSSLFLNTNEVIINTAFQTNSGVLNNLNSVNFSGNFGLDFNYLFGKNWSLNANPMFKAQLNTFTENSNGLSPFNIGIYTGVRYQF